MKTQSIKTKSAPLVDIGLASGAQGILVYSAIEDKQIAGLSFSQRQLNKIARSAAAKGLSFQSFFNSGLRQMLRELASNN